MSEAKLRDKLIGYLYPGIRPTLLFSEHDDDRVRQILLRGTSAAVAVTKPDYNRLNVSWIAPRGTIASYDERCYMFRFGETSGDSMDLVIVNEGTVPVDWRASISGWSIHPRFILNGTETLSVEYDADPGDVIILDAYSRTININGVPAWYAYIGDDSHWFQIPPGVNDLRIEHAGGVSAFGYPYARWQEPAIEASITDDFERANVRSAPTGSPRPIPEDTVAVPLAIDAGAVDRHRTRRRHRPPRMGVRPAHHRDRRRDRHVRRARRVQPRAVLGARPDRPLQGRVVHQHERHQRRLPGVVGRLRLRDHRRPDRSRSSTRTRSRRSTGWEIVSVQASPSRRPQRAGTAGLGHHHLPATYNLADGDEATTVVAGIGFRSPPPPSHRDQQRPQPAGVPRRRRHRHARQDRRRRPAGHCTPPTPPGSTRAARRSGRSCPTSGTTPRCATSCTDTAGEFSLRLDGVDVAGAYDLDTLAGAGTVSQIRIPTPNPTSSGTVFFDDFYLATGDAAVFIGPLDVANGSLAWELHQYDAGGASVNTVGWGHSVRLRRGDTCTASARVDQ